MTEIIETAIAEQTALKGRIQAWLHANRATADAFAVEMNEKALVACCREIERWTAKQGRTCSLPSALRGWS